MSKVYLCGGIQGLNDEQCHGWRSKAKELLICDTLDLMIRDYRGQETIDPEREIVENIVYQDIEDIKSSKYILVNASKPSWGTAMEVRAARAEFNKFVISFTNGSHVSPWLRFHSDYIVNTLEEACAIINKQEAAKYVDKAW